MKNLNQFIIEKFKINSKSVKRQYNYHPEDRDELKKLVYKLIKEKGNNVNLNDIDTSEITNMSSLFSYTNFNGDISQWDVSKVINMSWMFNNCNFNGDISQWDVSNVKDMRCMFYHSKFNQDISNWDVSSLDNNTGIFANCPLQNNPPKWYHG